MIEVIFLGFRDGSQGKRELKGTLPDLEVTSPTDLEQDGDS